ncbi:family 16 glycosylhydrolase [Cellvibrio japonicus]|uniref:Beta glucanase, putative, glu16C n=1 Tax=Cellvibrio japonicus (strain Ueda107) TaxID=498211 RepID=B3PHW2_CELJU|nr:family 16 glycosylhydrolase [Cellvibrio japonicus]ACE86252.1 beta glucanase, putative, glu16C [Cellvibrio japonicus Ueda107]QEI13900.1 family 16 glycosylhydrolase [Cellvibrio japonicus]QEI17474.1 family 16 glycosylhydrolase [Cellvibrio japonicus]QEI21050.1 family 16 glycosylhydrolase [Cellvibrio japonicus]
MLRCCLLLIAGALSTLLAASVLAKPYKGAELYSYEAYLYGRYEMRMRVARGGGVLSTFFTYKDGSQIGNTFWEEIDIEVFGKNNATQWQTNIILGSSRPAIHTEEEHTASTSLADAYHTYVLEWTPDYVAWYLDGEEVRRITGTSTVTSLTNPQSLRFNIWASESVEWTGTWDDSILPVYQFVDYISYQPYNTETNHFEAGWRDDFDSLDTSRWGKANWSFDTNRVDFVPENALVKDGILVLALTHENATGYSGTPPQDDSASSASSSLQSSASSSASEASSSSSESSSEAELSSSSPASSAAVSSSLASSSRASGGGGGGALHGLYLFLLAGLVLARRR